MKILVLFGLIVGLIGCNQTVNMNVSKPFEMMDLDGEIFKIKSGAHDTELSFNDGNKRYLELYFQERDDSDWDDEEDDISANIRFEIPKNVKIPKRTGEYLLKAEDSKQAVDLLISSRWKKSKPETVSRYQQCSYWRDVVECSGGRRPSCYKRRVFRTGRQWVEYTVTRTAKMFHLNFLAPDSDESLALIKINKSEEKRDYHQVGICR